MWPYDEMDDPSAEQRDDEAEREEREQAARDRLDDHAPAPRIEFGSREHLRALREMEEGVRRVRGEEPAPMGNECPVYGLVCDGVIGGSGRCCRQARVVVVEVPPGEGDSQIEFYRAMTGATSVKLMRVEWVRVEWEPMSDDAIRGGNDPF